MPEVVDRFMNLFRGLDRAYGTYSVKEQRESDGKKVGQALTKSGAVTKTLWINHLNGTEGIGIIPILDDSTVYFGAIDVDVYDGLNLGAVAKNIEEKKLPLCVCRSKSGGAHIYCFSKNAVPASKMQKSLKSVSAYLGFGGSEIFPKQTKVLSEAGDKGNWINMPYFNGLKGLRYGVRPDGDALSIEQFLDLAESLKVDEEWFNKKFVKTDVIPNGPPCLQILAQEGFPKGTRNNGLFNLGIYAKMCHPDIWEKKIDDFNHELMQPPLTSEEVKAVISSVKKGKYSYTCSQEPICSRCNSAVCRTRKFGVSFGSSSDLPSFGGLTKLDTKPPIWFWEIDETRIELSTNQLQDSKLFQARCMEAINKMPPVITRAAWRNIVSEAMEGLVVIEAPDEMSMEGQFYQMVEKFCTGRARATSIDDIILGRPYTNETKTYFRAIDLLSFLTRAKFHGGNLTLNAVTKMLKDMGAEHGFTSLRGKGVNYWAVRKFSEHIDKVEVPEELKDTDAF